MEARLWRMVYHIVRQIPHAKRPREQYSDRIILLVLVWAAVWNRPVYWACNTTSWPAALRDLVPCLPEDSTMSRRMKTLAFLQLLERTLRCLVDLIPPTLAKELDGMPMCVGGFSKDRDAKRGQAAGQMVRGYKLHLCAAGRLPKDFVLAPMNRHECVMAVDLIRRLSGEYGYAVCDNAFDTNELHEEAAKVGHQLVAPPRACNQGVRDIKHNRPERIRSLDMLDSPLKHCGLACRVGHATPDATPFARDLYNQRVAIESCFGELTAMGLGRLPNWVRRPRRVARWVSAVLIIYLTKNLARRGLLPKSLHLRR